MAACAGCAQAAFDDEAARLPAQRHGGHARPRLMKARAAQGDERGRVAPLISCNAAASSTISKNHAMIAVAHL
jgi:hypothetical protein